MNANGDNIGVKEIDVKSNPPAREVDLCAGVSSLNVPMDGGTPVIVNGEVKTTKKAGLVEHENGGNIENCNDHKENTVSISALESDGQLNAMTPLQEEFDACVDDFGDEIWGGVVAIELTSESGTSDDNEDLPCEFCSPRLEDRKRRKKRKCQLHRLYSEQNGALTLDMLDDDCLFYIASFLESRTIRFALTLVCRRFNALFGREAFYWKTRYTSQLGSKCRCPTARTSARFHASDQCLAWDDCRRVWKNPESETRHLVYTHNDLGPVDAVHLMNKGQVLVSGDRNRYLSFFDLTRYPGPEASDAQMRDMIVKTDMSTHGGWIWSIQSLDNMVFTGCWDKHIRAFDVSAGCAKASDYKCTSAVLSLYTEENEIIASCFDRKLYFIDRRSSEMSSRVFHGKAVLCVAGNENFIISGSEDKRICIFDRRAGKMFKVFKLENFPLSLSYSDDQLWFGDRNGMLHLHDGSAGDFKHVGTYDVGHTKKMTGVVNTPGAVFTCAGDRSVKVIEPARNPAVLASLDVHRDEVADVAYSHGVLATGGSDCISLWLPKYWDRNTYLL